MQKPWAIEPRLWPWIEFFSSGRQESWHLSWFINNLSSWWLIWDSSVQGKNAWSILCSQTNMFSAVLYQLYSVLMWVNDTPCMKEVRSPALRFHGDLIWLMAETCWGFILTCQCQEAPNVSFGDQPEMSKVCGPNSPFLIKLSSLFDHFTTSWELELLTYQSDLRLSRDLWSMLLLCTVT